MQTRLMAEQISADQGTIEYLRGEVARLDRACNRLTRCMDGRAERIIEQVDEIAALKAQNERLTAALREAVTMLEVDAEADAPGTDLYTFLKGTAAAALAVEYRRGEWISHADRERMDIQDRQYRQIGGQYLNVSPA